MNTSCNSLPALGSRRVRSFHYPLIPCLCNPESGEPQGDEATRAGRELAMQQELAAAMENARAEGVREGEARAKAAANQELEQVRCGINVAVEAFASERVDYFRHVEGEVVRLALAIARKVLHREVQMDPMLLAGVVRVTLDQMQNNTHVTLRASPACVEVWQGFCGSLTGQINPVTVLADEGLPAHAVTLETEVGTTAIDLDGQLQEIESGFFDLLHKRPERSGE